MGENNKEYRELLEEMLIELDEGCQPDKLAIDQLKVAKKALAYCGKQGKRKRKRNPAEGRDIRVNAAFAIWKDVLYAYTQPNEEQVSGFQRAFTMDGVQGYKKFVSKITTSAFRSVNREESLTREEKENWRSEFGKPDGWIDNVASNMGKNVWDYLQTHLPNLEKIGVLGNSGMYTRRKELLTAWSKELRMARTAPNVKYGNKVVQIGDLSITGAKGGTHPSRCVPDVRSIHFLRPQQILNMKPIRKGVQGDVNTCHILDCPLIPENVILVAKRFKAGNKHKRRADALQEVLMGGLNHRGIVGALAMTIQDPPRLVYDYYNGGDLASFIDKCGASWKGKSNALVDIKFVMEKKIFLESRLGIALALLETMQFLHSMERVHCDLHFGNLLLHFDYNHDIATKVYVGMCDFGSSKQLSQCQLLDHRISSTPAEKVGKTRLDYSQLAPELVGLNLAAYSKATNIYALGNIFKTLLQAPTNWDGMSRNTRCLSVGWISKNNAAKLDDMIIDMMGKNAKKRIDCLHWSVKMLRAFPDCRLHQQNSPFLRD